MEKTDPSIRDSARNAAAFPADDVLDRIIRRQNLSDRQIQKYLELLDRFWKRLGEHLSDVSRKPPHRAQAEKGDETNAESTGTDGSDVKKSEK